MSLPCRPLAPVRLEFALGLLFLGHSSNLAEAQRSAPALRGSPPAIGPIGAGGGTSATTGDSPLTLLERFSGHVDVSVQVLPYRGIGNTYGTFTVSGIPPGATILRAWVQVTSFGLVPGQLVNLSFAGAPQGSRPADVVDVGGSPPYECSLFRFEVTPLVTGDGDYFYSTSLHRYAYGDSLVVVYEHPSLPEQTVVLLDGSESLLSATTTSVFEDMPAGPGKLLLFTQADDSQMPGGESVRLNGVTIAGPGEVFSSNQGLYASLLEIPVTVEVGDNVLEVTTAQDWFGLHLAALSVEDKITLDFERDDAGIPLVNGQAVQGGAEFGVWVDIDGFPVSGLSAAIFDTDPGGPNDPSQDRDLLVGLGNALILQERPTQTVPGIYDRPNDDAHGGVFRFDFRGAPVRLCTLDLIDIDSGPEFATLQLEDALGRTRTYNVPAGWTEDLLVDGPPAWRTLDLTTLAPQPGHVAPATAVEDPGFDADSVLFLHVLLGGSGALDNLSFAPQ